MKDLLVIYNDATDRLKKGFKKYPKLAIGSQNLLQLIIKILLNQLGYNHFNVNIGSTLYMIIGEGYNPNDEDRVQNVVALAISQVEDKIKDDQSKETGLKPEEQLESLEIQSVAFNELQGHLYLDIKVKTKAARTYLIKI